MVSLRTNIPSLISIILISGTLAACQKHEAADHNSAGHGDHGTLKDWKFTLVKGDAATGRELFIELECYKCHEIKGENFSTLVKNDKGIGPELSQMAGSHPIEFFAESIANPNAVIDGDAKEEGHIGPDGKSKMPSFADVLTVQQLTDLATYLASLSAGGHKH